MGAQGLTIELAREEVIEILEGRNRCAAWFEQTEPDATRKFRSLHYTIDESGPQYSLKIQNAAGEWLYQQPYIASSIEDAGASSTITINRKGAFFQLRAGVRIVPKDGGPGGLSTSQLSFRASGPRNFMKIPLNSARLGLRPRFFRLCYTSIST